MSTPLEQQGFPEGTGDEIELYLRWLGFLRGAILRKALGLTDEQARWHPDGKLLPLLGLVNHLTGVETRWIDGEMLGVEVGKPADEYEPGPGVRIEAAIASYRRRAEAIPGSRYVELPGAAHLAPITEPSRVCGPIVEFLLTRR